MKTNSSDSLYHALDLCASNNFERALAIADQCLQSVPIPGCQLDPHFLAHAGRFVSNPLDGNHLFRAEH